jgi:UPF0755 protein
VPPPAADGTESDAVSFDEDDSSGTHDFNDPHDLIFGTEHHDDDHAEVDHTHSRRSRAERVRDRRRTRRRRIFGSLAFLVLVALVIIGFVAYNPTTTAKDYTGGGTGSVTIQVHPGDGIDAIGTTLVEQGVIASTGAFSAAAAANDQSNSIQAGYYRLHKQMSASAALTLMLDPASLVNAKVVIPEGTIEKDVVSKVATALGESTASVQTAAENVSTLAPSGYAPAGGSLSSLEGFLFPLTYTFNPGTSPSDSIKQLVTAYENEDQKIGFAAAATKIGITPYQALIIASIAQAEVKFPEDAAKVSRVILNRIAAGDPLQIDATSAYAAKVQGLDPSKVVYAQMPGPYNTYVNKGLPPTPIGNPGESSMMGAVNPPAGDWLFYVNIDAAGHLGFFDNQDDFTKAQQTCHDNGWGCAAP